jgi:hypothetical protein
MKTAAHDVGASEATLVGNFLETLRGSFHFAAGLVIQSPMLHEAYLTLNILALLIFGHFRKIETAFLRKKKLAAQAPRRPRIPLILKILTKKIRFFA